MKIISATDMNITTHKALEGLKGVQAIRKTDFNWVEEVKMHSFLIMKGIKDKASSGHSTFYHDFDEHAGFRSLSSQKQKLFYDEVLTVFDTEGYSVTMQDYSTQITW